MSSHLDTEFETDLLIDGVNPTDHVIDWHFSDIRAADSDLHIDMWEDTPESLGDRARDFLRDEIDTISPEGPANSLAKEYLRLVNWPRVGKHLLDNYVEWRADEAYRAQHDRM